MEIILALSPTIEGEVTSLYLQKILHNGKIKISKLARGLSTGTSLEYADQNTLADALKFRKTIKESKNRTNFKNKKETFTSFFFCIEKLI